MNRANMKYYNILILKVLIWEAMGLNIYKGYTIFMYTHETILLFQGHVPRVAIHKLIVMITVMKPSDKSWIKEILESSQVQSLTFGINNQLG
mgnify:CR=1 FL=1